MKRTLRLLQPAVVDLAVGQLFYAEQSPELGLDFRAAINADMFKLAATAGVHRKVHGNHRVISRRFPYAIFYQVEGGTVVIHTVLDCRRDPREIRQRLRGA